MFSEVRYQIGGAQFAEDAFDRIYNEAKRLRDEVNPLIKYCPAENIIREILFAKFQEGSSYWEIKDHREGQWNVKESKKFRFKPNLEDYDLVHCD